MYDLHRAAFVRWPRVLTEDENSGVGCASKFNYRAFVSVPLSPLVSDLVIAPIK